MTALRLLRWGLILSTLSAVFFVLFACGETAEPEIRVADTGPERTFSRQPVCYYDGQSTHLCLASAGEGWRVSRLRDGVLSMCLEAQRWQVDHTGWLHVTTVHGDESDIELKWVFMPFAANLTGTHLYVQASLSSTITSTTCP